MDQVDAVGHRRRRRRPRGRASAGAGRAGNDRRGGADGHRAGRELAQQRGDPRRLYYPPGSLKARLCVRGKELLYALCASHGVSHRRCGKLIVANSDAEVAALRGLQDRAAANGVPVRMAGRATGAGAGAGAALHGRAAVAQHRHRRQPRLHAGAAGRPGERRRHGGAGVAGRFGGAWDRAAARTWSAWPMAASSPRACWSTRASLHACALARRFEGLDARYVPREYFAKGNYYALAGRAPFTRLIYPAPADAWLGVHLTLDLGGQAKFGPDLEWLDVARRRRTSTTGRPGARRRLLCRGAALLAGLAGWRAAAQLQRRAAQDPRARASRRPTSASTGRRCTACPGLVNLFGIESPGLTSALAIAEQWWRCWRWPRRRLMAARRLAHQRRGRGRSGRCRSAPRRRRPRSWPRASSRAQDAADADDRKARAQRGAQLRDHAVAGLQHRRAGQAAGLLARAAGPAPRRG